MTIRSSSAVYLVDQDVFFWCSWHHLFNGSVDIIIHLVCQYEYIFWRERRFVSWLESRLHAKNQCSEYIYRFISDIICPTSSYRSPFSFAIIIFLREFCSRSIILYTPLLTKYRSIYIYIEYTYHEKTIGVHYFFPFPSHPAGVLLRFSGCTILRVAYSNEPCCVSVPNQPNSLPTPHAPSARKYTVLIGRGLVPLVVCH